MLVTHGTRVGTVVRCTLDGASTPYSVRPGAKYVFVATWKRKFMSARMPFKFGVKFSAHSHSCIQGKFLRESRSNFDSGTDSMIISKISR